MKLRQQSIHRREPHLEIQLLGGYAITAGNHSLLETLRSRKAQALLCYLIVSARPVMRATLCALFWPEMAEPAAKNNLRTTLAMLNKQFGPYLEINTNTVAFQRRLNDRVDVAILDARLDSALASRSIEALQTAVALYQGEFLEGFHLRGAESFDAWALQQREQWHLRILRALETLTARCVERNEYAIGIDAAQRLLTLEPWSEAAHRSLMHLFAANQQHDLALRQFARCRQILADELDVAPAAETTALYHAIQAGRPVAAARQARSALTTPPNQPPPTTPVQPAIPHNLSNSLTDFIGRAQELAWLAERLTTTNCRLLTIGGPGGMGKTRLALALGEQLLHTHNRAFPNGIFFVPLTDIAGADAGNGDQAPADDAIMGEAILHAIAEQLNTQPDVSLSSSQQLRAYLRTRRLLLILDNFEHLWAASPTLLLLLTDAPQVKLLVTSRFRLNLQGESLLPLDKLSLPMTDSDNGAAIQTDPRQLLEDAAWRESEAITLFVQHVQRNDPGFTVNQATIGPISRICQLVEGLPLGIVLAAGMAPTQGCDALAEELAIGLDSLATELQELPPDQRTLAAVFDRSWRLLDPTNQQLLARLAIFPGSFHRDAALQITGASITLFRQLLDRSLVSNLGPPRYMLHSAIQTFAWQKLQQWPEQVTALQTAFATFYLEFLARKETGLFGNAYGATITQIKADLDNVHLAWRYAVRYHLYQELNAASDVLFWFYDQQGFYLDVSELYHETLHSCLPIYAQQTQKVGTDLSQFLGRIYIALGVSYLRSGQFSKALDAYESSWAILQAEKISGVTVQCLNIWGKSIAGHDVTRAKALLAQSLALVETIENNWLKALTYQVIGESNLLFGNYPAAEAQVMAGYRLADRIEWQRGLASGHKALGRIYITRGRYPQAEEQLRKSIAVARQHHLKLFHLESMTMLGEVLALQGEFTEAQAWFAESRTLAEALGGGVLVAPILWEEGSLAEQRGDYQTAKRSFTQSLAIGLPNWWVHALPTLGWALIGLGELADARAYWQTVWRAAQAKERIPITLDAQAGLAYSDVLQANADQRDASGRRAAITHAATTFRQILDHPAATQQTRRRIAHLAATLDGG